MKIKYYLIFIFLFSFDTFSCNGSKVNLKNGANFLDLNRDGKKDVVFYAEFENNTSHPSHTLTVFIKNKDNRFNIIPVPNDSGFTWFDYKLSAYDIKIQDYELRVKNGIYYILFSKKKIDTEDIFGEHPVEFIIYEIKYNDEDAGISDYYWDRVNEFITKKTYKSVSNAILEFDDRCNL
ncbi:carbapenem self-resistance protein CarG family protein [Photorhabdus sp. CRCIA-P01]|uniref:carbapenem self-resistance protein CarG family protein n=1 Tax=Photorhabdus sp. CRCIA-P01 TaxID=2019570 RepID=UPI000E59FE57|nr:spore coat protein CotH [Photorhabdus sp. CRCIA-P01]